MTFSSQKCKLINIKIKIYLKHFIETSESNFKNDCMEEP